jgi:hypothetical protein
MATKNLVVIKNRMAIERFSIATCGNQKPFNHHAPMVTKSLLVATISFASPPTPQFFSSFSPPDGD